jgi:hypothetical protein
MVAPRVKAHETGPGIYRFLLGDAVLECRRNLHDDERFAASVEFLLALAEDLIQKHKAWWNRAMVEVLRDEEGRPLVELVVGPPCTGRVVEGLCRACGGRGGRHVRSESLRWLQKDVEIPKQSRYKQFAAVIVLARKTAQFDKKAEQYEEGLGFFNKVLDSKGGAEPQTQGHGQAEAEDAQDEEDEDEEDEDEEDDDEDEEKT